MLQVVTSLILVAETQTVGKHSHKWLSFQCMGNTCVTAKTRYIVLPKEGNELWIIVVLALQKLAELHR